MVCILFSFFFIVAQVPGKTTEPCPSRNKALPAELHNAATRAEDIAESEGPKRAAAFLADYLERRPAPDYAYPYYHLGYFRHKAGESESAIAPLKTAVDINPCFVEAWRLLAAVYHQKGLPINAARSMTKAAELSENLENRYQAALLWLDAEHPKEAAALLRTLSETPSPRPEWLVALSDALHALKKKVETAETMERAARSNKNPDLLYRAGLLWLDADRPEQALPLLKMCAETKQPKTEWLLSLCNTYMTLDRMTEAAGVMDRIIDMNAAPEYLYNGGLLWLQAEKPERALQHLIRLTRRPSPEADWFAALAHAYIQTDDILKAAEAMERAAEISGKPQLAYQAGLLRLQLQQADAALNLILPLTGRPDPEAEWMIAAANAYAMKEQYADAAKMMLNGAQISGKGDHFYQAAQLWLQADRPQKALPLLERLASKPSPEGVWLVSLSNTYRILDKITAAAKTMEHAAGITGEGDHYYRAAMLWRQTGNLEKTVKLLEICARRESAKQLWMIELASVFMELDRESDAEKAMARTTLTDTETPANIRYRGAVLWLNLKQPRRALPILEPLCRTADPKYGWLVSLVKTNVELDRASQARKTLDALLDRYPEKPKTWDLAVWAALQQSDYAGAAAAMEVAVRLDPTNENRLKELSRLYHMAGVPVKAVRAFQKTLENPAPEDWDRMTDIFLSAGRYDLALEPAGQAAVSGETAVRWETVGDIAYRLHRFEESRDAYRKAAALSGAGRIRLKAGYAHLKLDEFDPAENYFQQALNQSKADSSTARAAHRNLSYVQNIRRFFEQNGRAEQK